MTCPRGRESSSSPSPSSSISPFPIYTLSKKAVQSRLMSSSWTNSIAMAPSQFFILSLFLLIPFAVAQTSATIGVTYTTSPSTSDRVARFVESVNISTVHLSDANPDVIRSFSFTNVSLLLTIPNSMIREIGANCSNAAAWIHQHVVPFYPRARISAISVGNNVLDASSSGGQLLPAINNIHTSLHEIGIRNISISTTFSFRSLITNIFPSSARFRSPADHLLIRPLLQFLAQTKSSIFINMYPYNILRQHPEIPIEFALFQRTIEVSGVRYSNLFDMMVDAVHSAMAVSGYQSVPIIVTETGWPSSGYADELKATQPYAEKYVTGFVEHLKSGVGTPLRKEGVAGAYIYELFDRDDEQTRRKWGLFYSNMTKKYDIQPSSSIILRDLDLDLGGHNWS